ncbi:MAG: hypothetical protein ACYTFZ_00245 [Planctomycetota bacterium]|jgi:transcriptional regulator with XRE-family HTH domain
MSGKPTRRLPPGAGKTPQENFQMQEFARKLHDELNKRGWNNSDLARAVWGETVDKRGYAVARNRDRVGQYVAGKSYPEPYNLQKIADVLGVKPEDLAPELFTAAVERETPSVAITAAAGHPDKVSVVINMLLPFALAMEIGKLISDYQEAQKNEAT